MTIDDKINTAFLAFKRALDSYSPISTETWRALKAISQFRTVDKHRCICQSGEKQKSYAFVYDGLFRSFITDKNGKEYNKIFFDAGTFAGSMTALLTATPSQFTIEALEPATIVEIDFKGYRALLEEKQDLQRFQIFYLEKNWLLAKERREIEIVQNNATERYKQFLEEYPNLEQRLPQYHIASHLGISPTQLSRIRKKTGVINLCK